MIEKHSLAKGITVKSLLVLLMFCIPTLSYGDCQLTVRVSEFKPQYYQDSQGLWHGVAVELTQALFKEADCRIKFIKTPWKRAIHLLEYGGVDVVLNMSWTQARAKFTHYIGPMLDETQVMTVKAESDYKITSLEDIKKLSKRIGIQRGVFYGEALMNKLKNDPVFQDRFEYGSNESNKEKLEKDRILGLLNNQYTTAYKISEVFNKGVYKQHPFVFFKNNVYFGFSKKSVSSALREKFGQALIRLQAVGTLEKIAAKYR